MTQKQMSLSYISVFFAGVLLIGCAQDSNNNGNNYCDSPVLLDGQSNPDAPGYIVYLTDNVSVVNELNRLMGIYEIQVGAVYESLNGFFAEMNDDTKEKMRCEVSVESMHYNDVVTIL